MKVGDKVMRVPKTLSGYLDTVYDDRGRKRKGRRSAEPAAKPIKQPKEATVVYIHPKGRYHTVEFATRGGPVRESFLGVEG